MQPEAATRLITTTFDQPLEESQFVHFASNLVNDIDTSKAFASRHGTYIPQAFQGHIRQYKRPFVYYDPNGERLDVLLVRLQSARSLDRARTMQRNFAAWYLKQEHSEPVEAALVAYYHDDVPDWRFSFVRLEYAFGEDGLEEKLTPARRYSYLVGPNEPTHTAEHQLLPLLLRDEQNPTLDDIAQAFRVEVVSKQFFEAYKELFLQLVEALQTVVQQDAMLRRDFERAQVDLPNFAKKLLGQIVFLYFVQKKGWLGVEPGQKWGSGPRSFLRRLFAKQDGVTYSNFFNDVLEPLFYQALAIQRQDDLFTIGSYHCQIPFLNGGLFEPMGNYDWQNTRLLLPNTLFSNRRSDDDDQGTGILDVFDRYNFTVWEEEPLEKEVAVDPEMLGKVFENLLEVQDRKSKGAFYTPREIVHYMCQESLINYLHTQIGPISQDFSSSKAASKIGPISDQPTRDDIAVLVRQGALALQQDAAKEAGLQKGEYVLPASVRAQAAALDAALADIKLCDPAIGSGAFPVGMLHEIVQAREALTTYLDPAMNGRAKQNRTAYTLKRHAIQESIYGVDIDPGAVEIAKLRLWLSLVVDEENYDDIQPLPNLDYKIVTGNSLLGVQRNLFNNALYVQLSELKQKYFTETHRHEKIKLRERIDQLIELIAGKNNSFDFEVYFHEVFEGRGGFDVVIANPPYVRVDDIDKSQKAYFKNHYLSASGKYDLYYLFFERAISLTCQNATSVFITPNKFCAATSGAKLRELLLKAYPSIEIVSTSRLNVFDSAANYPIISICCRSTSKTQFTVRQASDIDKLSVKSTPNTYQLTNAQLGRLPEKVIPINATQSAIDLILRLIGECEQLGKFLSISEGLRVPSKYEVEEGKNLIIKQYQFERYSPIREGSYISDQSLAKIMRKGTKRHQSTFQTKIMIAEDALRINATVDFNNGIPQGGVYFAVPKNKNVTGNARLVWLGLLNTKLMSFIYEVLFGGMHMGGGYLRYRSSFLYLLPIKPEIFFEEQVTKISPLVEKILDYNRKGGFHSDLEKLEDDLEKNINQIYGLNSAEVSLINSYFKE